VPPLQRFAAFVNPDLIASWEGGSNQILVREPGRVLQQRNMTLTLRPERRTMVWARVEPADGRRVCFANLHASAGLPEKASLELPAAAASAVEWSEGDPLVFGGDMNLRPGQHPAVFAELRERFGLGEPTGPKVIDHLLARGLTLVEPARQLAPEERELPERGGIRLRLSDHAPVVARWDVGSYAAPR
jgi:endonuclease/exonuclease/phosphatase (EEP) superfamily protein YafD